MKVMENDRVLAIDPGPEVSGWVLFGIETRKPFSFGIDTTDEVLKIIEQESFNWLVIEKVGNQGNIVGDTIFDTCINIGSFKDRYRNNGKYCYDITRSNVIVQLYGFARKRNPDKTWFKVRDKHVNAVIIERFGGRDIAVGGVKCQKCKGKGWFGAGRPVCTACGGSQWLNPPGPLFGVRKHIWDALGLAMTFLEVHGPRHLSPAKPVRQCPPEFEDY